jgi:hypothetical protein
MSCSNRPCSSVLGLLSVAAFIGGIVGTVTGVPVFGVLIFVGVFWGAANGVRDWIRRRAGRPGRTGRP